MRDVDYCGDPKDVDVFDGVTASLRKLKNRGYKVFVITNQSGIARGYITEEQYRAVEREVLRQVGEDLIDTTYMCPDKPNSGSKRRKPSPEMILEAARDHHLDLAQSFFIGDKQSDIESGRRAGVKTILVRTGYGKETDEALADFVARDLNGAADIILKA